MELSDLKKIGLTNGEIKLYSALLDLGESTRTELAKKSGISPSKIYDVANRLLEKGIISSIKKQTVTHFIAANPDKLKEYIKSKEEDIMHEKELINKMLPMLLSKYRKTEAETDVEVFYGWEGMRTVFKDLSNSLGKGDISYVFGASQGKMPKQADIFFTQYYTRVKEKGYKIKIIFNEEVKRNKERIDYFMKSKLHEVRFLYQSTFTEINFYKNTVLFIMLLENPIVIRVKNQEMSDSFMKFFNSMWKLAKK